MTEGQGRTAASVPPGTEAGTGTPPGGQGSAPAPAPVQVPAAEQPMPPDGSGQAPAPPPAPPPPAPPSAPAPPPAPASPPAASDPGTPASPPAPEAPAEPSGPAGAFRRVDARPLESALLQLRHSIVEAQFFLEAPGVEEARAERHKLLSQIDDYLLPRLRESGSPILVALVGSTGAGKSTLVNSIVGTQVSMTGIRRPTTNSPVLACHPDDVGWFAENVFLPTVPRVRQQGLARSGRDGLLVLAASEGMPKGVALLDTPDIDSVVQAHREFAHQFLDASDLWLFMTTASRYADAAVWELLQHARDRGAALGIVLSRVAAGRRARSWSSTSTRCWRPTASATRSVSSSRRPCSPRAGCRAEASAPIRRVAGGTAASADRRVAVLTQTMSGVLDTFRVRVPALAAQVEAQRTAPRRADRRGDRRLPAGARRDRDQATADGSLLRGEVLARWQDFAGTGDLLRIAPDPARRPGGSGRRANARCRAPRRCESRAAHRRWSRC